MKQYKPPIKSIIDKPKSVIPNGYHCIGAGMADGKECPFLQFRKMTKSRLNHFKKIFINSVTGIRKEYYDIPYGNKHLQYCSLLKAYLEIQDCIKDCDINIEV